MNKIKTIIDSKGISLNDFYVSIIKDGLNNDIKWTSLCSWYYGRSFPRNARLKTLAKLLGVAPVELMDDELLHRGA